MPSLLLKLHPDDNIAVALQDLSTGAILRADDGTSFALHDTVPLGHKLALLDLPKGSVVKKYGEVIGLTTCDVPRGSWIHSHNLENPPRQVVSSPRPAAAPKPLASSHASFEGYVRADGSVGTRNYIAVIASVNCSATVAHAVADRFPRDRLADWPAVDGVLALTHHGGCGLPRGGIQWNYLSRVLEGMSRHPNIAAALVIGLGCEQLTAQDLVQMTSLSRQSEASPSRPARLRKTLVMQETGGTEATIEAAERIIGEWLPQVGAWERETAPASALVVATECGGSDAFSGITANPAVGHAVDRLIACGGTAVLSETPEVVGAEQILLRRSVSDEVRRSLIERIEWWEWYAGVFGAKLDHNPSVGNKAGGLTTITEKSLGAVLKGGSSPLRSVVGYGESIPHGGLVFMDTPGFDPPSVTGMVAGGANLVLFTTGRGSCFGATAAPTIKIATTSRLAHAMSGDIDVDAGVILGGRSPEHVGEEIFQAILRVASGEPTSSERLGYGRYEFVPWSIGPVL